MKISVTPPALRSDGTTTLYVVDVEGAARHQFHTVDDTLEHLRTILVEERDALVRRITENRDSVVEKLGVLQASLKEQANA